MPAPHRIAGPQYAGDNAHLHEPVPVQRVESQPELDARATEIDLRLRHPRRRVTDAEYHPSLPDLERVPLTSELLDEMAWRVAEQMRRHAPIIIPTSEPLTTLFPSEEPDPELKPGKMMMISFRMPRLPWPLRLLQRRRHPTTTIQGSA